MIEEKARTKWCPMVRFTHFRDGSDDESNCIGSGCMMWQWHKPKRKEANWTDGYCGLAWKPHRHD